MAKMTMSPTAAAPPATPHAESSAKQHEIIRDLEKQLRQSNDNESIITGALCKYWPGARYPLVTDWLFKEYRRQHTSPWPSSPFQAMAKYSPSCRNMLAG
jgi:hypothetical protein